MSNKDCYELDALDAHVSPQSNRKPYLLIKTYFPSEDGSTLIKPYYPISNQSKAQDLGYRFRVQKGGNDCYYTLRRNSSLYCISSSKRAIQLYKDS